MLDSGTQAFGGNGLRRVPPSPAAGSQLLDAAAHQLPGLHLGCTSRGLRGSSTARPPGSNGPGPGTMHVRACTAKDQAAQPSLLPDANAPP